MSTTLEASQKNDQKTISFEDVIERSRELGLTIPKNQMEMIKSSLETGTMSGAAHMEHIEKVSEKLNDKGLRWTVPESHDPKMPLHYLVDKHSNVQVYIVERTNSESHEPFYVANRKTFDFDSNKSKHTQMTTGNSVEAVKINVAAYYTGAAIKEVAKDLELSNQKPQKSGKSDDYSLSR
jgi:hypothetical protein